MKEIALSLTVSSMWFSCFLQTEQDLFVSTVTTLCSPLEASMKSFSFPWKPSAETQNMRFYSKRLWSRTKPSYGGWKKRNRRTFLCELTCQKERYKFLLFRRYTNKNGSRMKRGEQRLPASHVAIKGMFMFRV